MYSSSDFERLFIRYKAEAMPEGESIQAFCLKNKVPYNLFHNGTRILGIKLFRYMSKAIRRRIQTPPWKLPLPRKRKTSRIRPPMP